jgi:hypothetical protein
MLSKKDNNFIIKLYLNGDIYDGIKNLEFVNIESPYYTNGSYENYLSTFIKNNVQYQFNAKNIENYLVITGSKNHYNEQIVFEEVIILNNDWKYIFLNNENKFLWRVDFNNSKRIVVPSYITSIAKMKFLEMDINLLIKTANLKKICLKLKNMISSNKITDLFIYCKEFMKMKYVYHAIILLIVIMK